MLIPALLSPQEQKDDVSGIKTLCLNNPFISLSEHASLGIIVVILQDLAWDTESLGWLLRKLMPMQINKNTVFHFPPPIMC